MTILRTVLGIGLLTCASIGGAQEFTSWTVETIYPLSIAPAVHGGPGAVIATNSENGRPVVAFLNGAGEPGDELTILYDYPAGQYGGWDYLGFGPLSDPISDLDMDFWISPAQWKIGISYRNRTSNSLWFLEVIFDRSTEDFAATNKMIKDEVSFNHGVGTSVRYDSTGLPHIASHVSSLLGLESLMYVVEVSSGGNCGEFEQAGKWNCQIVQSGDEVGRQPFLVLDGAEQPVIAYIAPNGEVDLAWIARPTSTGAGSCGGGYWNCGYVNFDLAIYDHSQPSVHFDQSPASTGIHVGYLATNHYGPGGPNVRHALWVGGGDGDCGFPLDWDCGLGMPGEMNTASGDSLVVGTNASGNPVFTFAGAVSGEMALIEFLNETLAGNCGTGDTWNCSYLAQDSGSPDLVGEWADLTVGADGESMVVFTKWDNSGGAYDLEFAYPWVFRDGFESGDSVVWFNSVP